MGDWDKFDEADEKAVMGCFLAFLILMLIGSMWLLVVFLKQNR